jgi:putative membrane protein
MDAGYPSVQERRPELAKKLNKWAWAITVFITVAVVGMQKIVIPLPEGVSFLWLPPVYSTLNALAGVCLLFSLYFIKQGDIVNHKKANVLALLLSVLFILGYVAYHMTTASTKFGGEGAARTFYLILLATHVILAAISLPLILFTFIKSYTGLIVEHKKMARWVYPIWLYVCLTGPICYLMLRPYYPS